LTQKVSKSHKLIPRHHHSDKEGKSLRWAVADRTSV
jgi:hypothetical protein